MHWIGQLAMRALSLESIEAKLHLIASRSKDHLAVQGEALALLRQAIPFEVGVFSSVDPATLLWTSCVICGVDPDPSREAFVFENEYRQDDLHKISDLVRGPERAMRLSAVEPEVLEQSARYQLIRAQGAGDELRCALLEGGNCWGSLELYRATGAGPFSDDEVKASAALSAPLARLVRLGLLKLAASRPGALEDPPGVAVLNGYGDLEAVSPAAERLLGELGAAAEGCLPPGVLALSMRLDDGREGSVSMIMPRASGGWLRVHAGRLLSSDGEKKSIVLEPVKPAVLSTTVARLYGFTSREREVIKLVAQGLSGKEIGTRLGISPYTVNDHTKAVYQKAGVQSRQQLVAALFFDHYLPRRESNASPGPYGWFLED